MFIDRHRADHGVEPICKALRVAPSAYWRHAACRKNPELRSERVKRDERLMPELRRAWDAHRQVYGADKLWRQLRREDVQIARCTVERLMRRLGIEGVPELMIH